MYMGIDIGTSAVKAIVMDRSGAVADQASTPLRVSRRQHEPETFARIATVLLPKDYVRCTAIESLSVIGGGARSPYWGRILSSALRRPLTYRDAGTVGPAYGAARLARMAAERASIDEVCTQPPILRVAEPDNNLSDLYAQRIGRFRSLYRQLKDSFVETTT